MTTMGNELDTTELAAPVEAGVFGDEADAPFPLPELLPVEVFVV